MKPLLCPECDVEVGHIIADLYYCASCEATFKDYVITITKVPE